MPFSINLYFFGTQDILNYSILIELLTQLNVYCTCCFIYMLYTDSQPVSSTYSYFSLYQQTFKKSQGNY